MYKRFSTTTCGKVADLEGCGILADRRERNGKIHAALVETRGKNYLIARCKTNGKGKTTFEVVSTKNAMRFVLAHGQDGDFATLFPGVDPWSLAHVK